MVARRFMALIERAEVARAERLLPLGLADGVAVREAVPQGMPITYDMVAPNRESVAYQAAPGAGRFLVGADLTYPQPPP